MGQGAVTITILKKKVPKSFALLPYWGIFKIILFTLRIEFKNIRIVAIVFPSLIQSFVFIRSLRFDRLRVKN
jgi:hypothetical protein